MQTATWIIRRRPWLLAAWLIAVPGMLYAAGSLRDRMVAFSRLPGSESALVEDLLATRFGSPFAQPLLLVARGLPPQGGTQHPDALRRVHLALTRIPGVSRVLSPLNSSDTLLRGSQPGAAIFIAGFDPAKVRGDSLLTAARRATGSLAEELRAEAPGLTLRWTGLPAVLFDMREASAKATRRSELMALPFILLLLLLAFRSVVAAFIPLVFGVLAIGTSLGAALLASSWGTPALLLSNVVSILGLALGVDYSLLTVTRFRDGLRRGDDPHAAAVYAVRTAGHTILLSGSTVALGFAGLLLVPISEVKSVGLGGLVTAIVTVALATTLLPVLLSALGQRIDLWPVGRGPSSAPGEWWFRWGRWVTAHPVLVLVVAGLPLVLLSISGFRINPAAPRQGWLPHGESTLGLEDLERLGRASLTNELSVLIDLSARDDVARFDWSVPHRIARLLERDERVAAVRSVPALAESRGVPPQLFWQLAPPWVREHFATRDFDWMRMDVIPAAHLSQADISGLIRDVRSLDVSTITGQQSALLVGGVAAFQADYEAAVRRSAPRVVLIVVGSVLLALSIGFRSLLIPVKATILNLLTVGAAFGALVLVFQDGFGASLLGLPHPLSGVFPAVPIMAFCIVFGLSMDYEVFLVGRIAELRRAFPEWSERDAIVEGMARTGRVITFAAALMIVVFAGFAAGDYLPSKLFGFALAVAVLADATLVRLAIGPALLQLAGRWNWWPGDDRARARVRVEGSEV